MLLRCSSTGIVAIDNECADSPTNRRNSSTAIANQNFRGDRDIPLSLTIHAARGNEDAQ